MSMGANQAQTCFYEVLVIEGIEGLVTLRSYALEHGLVRLVLAWSRSRNGVGG